MTGSVDKSKRSGAKSYATLRDMLIAVDTGGTKTLVAGFSHDGKLQVSEKFETPTDRLRYIVQLTGTILKLVDKKKIDAIVVALPGRIDTKGVLVEAPNLGWRRFDVKKQLQKTFNVPILVENDANLAGLAEATILPSPVNVCLYITVSTGIGTGIITSGQIDPHFSQSEGGHIVLNYRGKEKIWESFASGKAIYKAHHAYARDIKSHRIWKHIAKNIAEGLLVHIPILSPDIIIIGGSIGTYFSHYGKYLHDELRRYLATVPPVIQAKHPEQAVIYGCYYYALSQLTDR